MIVSGSYSPVSGAYRMHAPEPPYSSIVYIGYTLKQMQRKYRQDFNLKYKHIDWIII